jgi:hypothetical protein
LGIFGFDDDGTVQLAVYKWQRLEIGRECGLRRRRWPEFDCRQIARRKRWLRTASQREHDSLR